MGLEALRRGRGHSLHLEVTALTSDERSAVQVLWKLRAALLALAAGEGARRGENDEGLGPALKYSWC